MNTKSVIDKTRNLLFISILLFIFLIASGCVAMQPFPNIARSGDTVLVAVGSPDGMTKSNTTALYIPDDGSPSIDLTAHIRSIFKLYPDQTSSAWLAQGLVNSVTLDSQHGPWLTVVAIDLVGVNEGTGNIQFTTPATISTQGTPINGWNFPVEVLAGTGQTNQFQYDIFSGTTRNGDLSLLEPLLQIAVKPPTGSDGTTYGAIQYKLNVPLINNDGSEAPDGAMTVVLENMALTHQMAQIRPMWIRNNDEVTVIITSPTATMEAWQAKFSIVIFEQSSLLLGLPGSTIDVAKPAPSLISIEYFDVNGNVVAGPTPSVIVENSTI